VATSATENLLAFIRDYEVRPASGHMIRAAHGQPSSLQFSALICERQHMDTPVSLDGGHTSCPLSPIQREAAPLSAILPHVQKQ
jgi:hypothetical protein